MEKFELQKAMSQLLNALKSHLFWRVNFFQIGCFEQLKKKSHYFNKIIFVTSSPELYCETLRNPLPWKTIRSSKLLVFFKRLF